MISTNPQKPERPAVILLSGGLDSATTAAIARREGYELYALSVDYGQRHHFESDISQRCCDGGRVISRICKRRDV